jgi:hypothetical protein
MESFNHLLNWKLKEGSHRFPGPDGGTCINEAALVAAGFPYQRISNVRQMPFCFSQPICDYAMWLNDTVSDEERQRLLPYVTRLACADMPAIERRRGDYIAQRTRMYWSIPSMDFALDVLEGALAIGRRADLYPVDEVRARMETVRPTTRTDAAKTQGESPAPEVSSATPLLSKVKSWFAAKETA